jgi:excisionase family DNA binding protein
MESIKERGPLLLRRAEAQRLLGIGPSKYKQIVANGGIREVAIGLRGRRVSYAELERFVEGKQEATE